MPKPRLKGEAVRTSQRIALSRCSLTKKREHWGLVMRKCKLCKRTESNTESPSLCYRLWPAFATDSDKTDWPVKQFVSTCRGFQMSSLFLLTLYERILRTKSGFGCYYYYRKKETIKLTKLKKVVLLTFTFELMWPELMLLWGLTQPQK